jgi:NAD(P)H dehydrogenase (quinone)
MPILVTGATGQVGYRVVEELADAGAEATAMVRVAARAQDLPPVVAHVVASLDDPPPPEVLQEFDRVFLMSPSREEQVELEILFIDALVAAGHHPHVVKLSADGFQDVDCTVRFMRNHRLIARHLDATGLPVTYVAPCRYMENLLAAADEIKEKGLLSAPAGAGRVGFVASRDVAAIAARVLLSDGQENRTYLATGPETLGYADVAARISAVFARQVDYEDVTPDRAGAALRETGLSAWNREGMLELFEWIRHGGCDVVTTDVRDATGEDPHPIEHWLGELRGAFLGPRELRPPRF